MTSYVAATTEFESNNDNDSVVAWTPLSRLFIQEDIQAYPRWAALGRRRIAASRAPQWASIWGFNDLVLLAHDLEYL